MRRPAVHVAGRGQPVSAGGGQRARYICAVRAPCTPLSARRACRVAIDVFEPLDSGSVDVRDDEEEERRKENEDGVRRTNKEF